MRRIATVLLLGTLSTAAFAKDTPAARLKVAFGGDAVEAVERFDYRLTLTDSGARVLRDTRYVLLPGTRRLHAQDLLGPVQVWSGEDGSWELRDGQWSFLGSSLAAMHRQHVAYHFLALLRDPGTRYEPQEGNQLRLKPTGASPFQVRLDTTTGRISENRFDGGRVAREFDYQRVGGVWWPMGFELLDQGRTTATGRFSETAVDANATLPPMPATEAPRKLPSTRSDVAALVGAGWMSGPRNDYNLSSDAAGRTLVFARSQPEFEQAQIFVAWREGAAWSAPQPVPFSDPRYSDSDPWLTPDGRMLYFVSNRPVSGEAPRKDLELWRVALRAEGFGKPEHLAALSSDGQELGPELHDGWLYFNSTRASGPAKMAIYRARVRGTGFDAPEALEAPFNNGPVQGDFTLSPDGRLALFWSQRDGSREPDLFAARRQQGGWSAAVRLPSPFNAAGLDFTPSFSSDGRALYFASMRKPAWLDDPAHVFNGQANVYIAPVAMIEEALENVPGEAAHSH